MKKLKNFKILNLKLSIGNKLVMKKKIKLLEKEMNIYIKLKNLTIK